MGRTFRFGIAPTLYAPPETGAAAVADPPPAPAAAPTPPAVPVTPPASAGAQPPAAPATPPTPPAEPAPAPAVPEKYALTLPEGSPFTADMLPAIEAEAKALSLTNDAAQGLLDARIASAKALGEQYLADAKADAEIGGGHFEQTCELARAGRDWLFPQGSKGAALVVQFFEATGLGNHPEFLRAFARIGRATREDRPVSGGPASTTEPRLADLMYPTSRAKSA